MMNVYLKFCLLEMVILPCSAKAQDQVIVPYTLADKDLATRTEIRIDALGTKMDTNFASMDTKFAAIDTKFAAIDTKIEALNERIDSLFWIVGLLVALVIFNLG